MPKKFFDILPPDDKIERKERFVFRKQGDKPKKGLGLLWILVILIAGALCLFFLYSLRFSRAEIEILPRTEKVSFNTEMEVKKGAEGISLKDGVVPGKFTEEKKELSMEFSSSGKILKKEYARGKIRVYNKYSRSVTLRKNTHFRSDEGKEFHILKSIRIPAKGYLDGVEVVADNPGPEYNIKPSKFSVPKLRNYSQRLFMDVYGESTEAMKGGFLGETPQVAEEDISNAEKKVLEKLFSQGKQSLKKNIPEDYVLLDDLIKLEVLEKSPLAKAGQELESFVFKAKITSKGFIFKKTDIEKFARQFVQSKIGDKKIAGGSLGLNYPVKQKDFGEGRAVISLRVSAKIYSPPNLEKLKEKVKGKSQVEAEYLLEKEEGVSKVKIKLSPFWIRTIPQKTEKIEINPASFR